jgi:hypothetical protein
MKKIPWLFGSALAGSMDLAVGVLIATIISSAMSVPVVWWHLLVGAVLAILPDFDIIFQIVTFGHVNSAHHRSPLHRPVLLLPLITIVGWLAGGEWLAYTAFICVLWHYVHDTKGFGGGGIAWAWPFSKKYWSLTGSHELYHMNHAQWIENYWLKPTKLSIREVMVALLALVLALAIIVLR